MIIVISLGTVVSSIIIAIQKRGRLGERLSKRVLRIAKILACITCATVPPHIEKERFMEAFDVSMRTAELVKPSKATTEASKKWMHLRRAKSGVAVVSNKSTDPHIHTASPATEKSTAVMPLPTLPSRDLFNDDIHSDGSSRPATGDLPIQADKGNVFQQLNTPVRQNRQLALAEFEWLASVVERSCFVIFVLCFLVITVGINFVGFIHWYSAGLEHYGR
ncbi:unnamed protein product [Angiostrongylus costaricensis]|uniref:Uncharacterized protein n=1 Tax=Angiostrongylus costaricensis TaxID=334426 RepID=A0A158PI20_ANGCS|nr:unnamed protein product [Angiostrongylus costaricensis]